MLFSFKKKLHLTLVRHGQSESNKNKTFTGWNNVNLTEKGKNESIFAGSLLKNANKTYTKGYTSFLIRAVDTYNLITNELEKESGKDYYF
jgi:2,3-bisphosphoglycerate-dependent phosphoglycerate mutase